MRKDLLFCGEASVMMVLFFKCLGELIREATWARNFLHGKVVNNRFGFSTRYVWYSPAVYLSDCGFTEGSFFFLWLLSGLTSCFFHHYVSMCLSLCMCSPWDSWFPLNLGLDVFHWFLKLLGHFIFKYIACAPGPLSSLGGSSYRHWPLMVLFSL